LKIYKGTPIELLASLWHNRSLILALTRRDIVGRYRGSFLGVFWSFVNPLLMLGVYTFALGVVLGARWTKGSDSHMDFAVILFSGMLVFNLFAECVNRASSLVLSNPSYVKKVVFPLEILPVVSFCSSLFHMVVSLSVWVLFYLIGFGVPSPAILLLPVVMLPLVLFTIGISWILASLGVYLRDVGHMVSSMTLMLMFLSAVFYPIDSLPEALRGPLMVVNPLVFHVEICRQVMVWGKLPAWSSWSIYFAFGLGLACLGFAWFQKTRRGFADVL
jgi:lipopolysaccharide transport system permease protein